MKMKVMAEWVDANLSVQMTEENASRVDVPFQPEPLNLHSFVAKLDRAVRQNRARRCCAAGEATGACAQTPCATCSQVVLQFRALVEKSQFGKVCETTLARLHSSPARLLGGSHASPLRSPSPPRRVCVPRHSPARSSISPCSRSASNSAGSGTTSTPTPALPSRRAWLTSHSLAYRFRPGLLSISSKATPRTLTRRRRAQASSLGSLRKEGGAALGEALVKEFEELLLRGRYAANSRRSQRWEERQRAEADAPALAPRSEPALATEEQRDERRKELNTTAQRRSRALRKERLAEEAVAATVEQRGLVANVLRQAPGPRVQSVASAEEGSN
ncbi:hypothetical protein T492DRAFT_231565 [Pavlovales sp. CCMP2436]|nr:hypothetical protein T492DRAFT_231565 [Pavlovales sp. CCMP2436]